MITVILTLHSTLNLISTVQGENKLLYVGENKA